MDVNLRRSNGECIGEDDVLRWEGEVGPSRSERAHEAAGACPMRAIRMGG